MIMPKLIPIEKSREEGRQINMLPRTDEEASKKYPVTRLRGDKPLPKKAPKMPNPLAPENRSEELQALEDKRQDEIKRLKESNTQKWQPKHKVSTARNRKSREGYMNIGHHTGRQNLAHGVIEQMEKGDTPMTVEEQARLNNTAVQLEKMFGLEGTTRPEASLDYALDLYDDVLQKADMDWDNVSDEDLVQLEKLFGIKNPLKREKSTKEKAEKIGLDTSAVSDGKPKREAPNVGFASNAERYAKIKQAANAKRASSESPSRRSAARRENIKRAPGRATRAAGSSVRDAGSRAADVGAGAAYGAAGGVDRASSAAAAGGRAAASGVARGARAVGRGASRVGQAVEPAGMQRRRGGGPKPPPSNRQQRRAAAQERNTPARPSRFSRAFGATKRAAKEFGQGFTEGGPIRQTQPKAAPTTPKAAPKAPKEGKQLGFDLSKATISLQKFLDNDCGCDSPK
jgi:hypothetical protein